ncbi:MAG: rod shape-determining protein RodA [Phycisphaerales bacterium]|nr:MAG: rod shape-determining protein RodA [Phycisphaerales bacterium]
MSTLGTTPGGTNRPGTTPARSFDRPRGAVPGNLRKAVRPRTIPRLELGRPEAWALVACSLALALLGVSMIDMSGGSSSAEVLHPLAMRQAVFLGVGLMAGLACVLPHYRWLGRFAWIGYAATIALLIFLLIPFVPSWLVAPRNGSRGWIDLGPASLQPSELAKVAYVLALAMYLRYRKNYRTFTGFIPPAIITVVPMALILVQPDLGTCMLFIPTLFAMLVAAGARMKHIVLVVAMGLVLAPFSYPLLRPHQKERIVAMVTRVQGDYSRADSSQYQSLKAITLTGAGGVTGLDATHSRAVIEFNALPERHNDMIFVMVVNRHGLIGGLGVLGLYLVWFGCATTIAARCRDPFGRLVAVGLCAMVAAQTVVNLGVCVGLLPVTGVTLPFVSYGGSSLVALFLTVGLLVNISIRPPLGPMRKSFEYADDD